MEARPAATEQAQVREAFDSQNFDRDRWSIDPRSCPGLKSDLLANALHLVIPPGSANRPPAGLQGKFKIEGDFEIRMDYLARSLPRPQKDWSNVEIEIEGGGGAAAVIRTHHSKEGQGYTLWFGPSKGSGKAGKWKQIPTNASAGTLRLERSGGLLRYWVADQGQEPRKLGEVDYGTDPVDRVNIRVTAPASRSATDVTFDNIEVKADRIVGPSATAKPLLRRWETWVAALVVFSSLGALGYRAMRRPTGPSDRIGNHAGGPTPPHEGRQR
jgi:hypothetical protein